MVETSSRLTIIVKHHVSVKQSWCLAAHCFIISELTKQEMSKFSNSFCKEIYGKRTVFSRKLKGNRNFDFPLGKLLGKRPFPQNIQPKEHWEISPFFAKGKIHKEREED